MTLTKEQIESMNRTDAAIEWLMGNPEKEEKLITSTLALFDSYPQFQRKSREETMKAIAKDYWEEKGKAGSFAVFYDTPSSEFERKCALEAFPEENAEEQIKENVGLIRAESITSNCRW